MNPGTVTVKLPEAFTINHLCLDFHPGTGSYYVEVAIDSTTWFRVVDHSAYPCQSKQKLFFNPRCVRYIRVVVTRHGGNELLQLASLEAASSEEPFRLSQRILVPRENVASLANGARGSGSPYDPEIMLNGDFVNYGPGGGYSTHRIGSDCLMVQLSQPYMLDSMRLLLYDKDPRSYKYYIETSSDKEEWTRAVDRTGSECRSWQNLRFEPRPVVFIKIVGTHNTANKWSHVVHFECPSQVPVNN